MWALQMKNQGNAEDEDQGLKSIFGFVEGLSIILWQNGKWRRRTIQIIDE
jgi:hypothetical protein